jgi:archaemetzincin
MAKTRVSINLVRFGYVDSAVIRYLAKEIKEIFQINVKIRKSLPIPRTAFNSNRNQYRATQFLNMLATIRTRGKIIGICDVDLYTKNYNYVFGLADPTQESAVISLDRLEPIIYGLYQDDTVFFARALKETMHELGHLYGLEHCHRDECAMHFSYSLLETDIKRTQFCSSCQRELIKATEQTIKP